MNDQHLRQFIAHRLNNHHERTGGGFYGGNPQHGNRWFGARTDRGALELTPDWGRSWVTIVLGGLKFWNGEGCDLIVTPPHEVRVRLSAAIRNEYQGRAVFGGDDEWPAVPDRIGWMTLPYDTASAMLDDAEFQADVDGNGPDMMPTGTRRAYRALVDQLRAAMQLPPRGHPAVPSWCGRS